MRALPHLSVVIPTCNRPEDMRRCLHSLAAVTYPHWDVAVIDQSDDDRTEQVVRPFIGRLPEISYRHLRQKGVSNARNVGMATTRGAIIAFLDDDCTVTPDWLRQVALTFGRRPDAALVFGVVTPIAHDPSRQYVPCCHVSREQILHGRLAFRRLVGMSASMYVNRAATERVGPFDPSLGAGAHFPSGEDRDYPYRYLARGLRIIQTPQIAVAHHGVREFAHGEVTDLLLGYAYAEGVVQMKFARLGDWASAVLIVWHCWDNLRGVNYRNLLARRRPTHLNRLVLYLRGLRGSFQRRVNRQRRLYVVPRGRDRRCGDD